MICMPREPLDKTPDNWRGAGRKQGEVTKAMAALAVGEGFYAQCAAQSVHTRAVRLGIKITTRSGAGWVHVRRVK